MVRHGGVVLAAVILSACAPVTPDSIEGEWTFVGFSVEGETHDVVVDENTRTQPWVVLTSNGMNGSAGCNQFGGAYRYDNGTFEAHSSSTLMWCGDHQGSLMQFEFLFSKMTTGDPLTVTRQGNRIIWTGTNSSLILEEGLPEGITFPPR